MKTRTMVRVAVTTLAIALYTSGVTCVAQNTQADPRNVVSLQPFAGAGGTGGFGYEEIPLSATSWYVAYFGKQNNTTAEVDAAWAARVAQLCTSVSLHYFVQLRYVYEPVLAAKHTSFLTTPSYGRPYRVVFLINYAQLAGDAMQRSGEADVPHKTAAILCVSAPALLLNPTRAVPVSTSSR